MASATGRPGTKVTMTTRGDPLHAREPVPDHEQKRVALSYLHEAWAEARLDGIDDDAWRRPACSPPSPNWSPPTARKPRPPTPKASSKRIRNGEFTVDQRRQ